MTLQEALEKSLAKATKRWERSKIPQTVSRDAPEFNHAARLSPVDGRAAAEDVAVLSTEAVPRCPMIETSQFAFPKPKDARPLRERLAFIIHRDGREVCQTTSYGRQEYKRRRNAMYDRDKGICCICGTKIYKKSEATFEHKQGRGMGGAKRDDRIENNGVAHLLCNTQKGSKVL